MIAAVDKRIIPGELRLAKGVVVFLLQGTSSGNERGTSVTNLEPYSVESEPVEPAAWPTVPTWRYLGDRAAADVAYCARFGTSEAPTPSKAPGGLWAYVLPTAEAPH